MPGMVSCISCFRRERIRQHFRVYATLPSSITATSAAVGMNPRPAYPVRSMFGLVHIACFQATTFLSETSDVHLGAPFLAEQRRARRSCISHSHRERHLVAITRLHKQQHVPSPASSTCSVSQHHPRERVTMRSTTRDACNGSHHRPASRHDVASRHPREQAAVHSAINPPTGNSTFRHPRLRATARAIACDNRQRQGRDNDRDARLRAFESIPDAVPFRVSTPRHGATVRTGEEICNLIPPS
jgi:hypothetical protein